MIPAAINDTGASFAGLLRQWRQKRRLSQLELALSSGVSQRHVSYLESGRANPSRGMILQLSETLDVPLRDRNAWLTAAGFAPLFRARSLDDPQMAQILGVLAMMLKAHEPFPALVLDRAWTVLMANDAFERLVSLLGEDFWSKLGGGERNLMRLFFHPDGIGAHVTNWATVGPLIWWRAQREAEAFGGAEMRAVLDELAPYQSETIRWANVDAALMPMIPFDMRVGETALSMFAVVTTFGTAQDVTAEELRLETLYPADAQTEALLRAAAVG